MPPYAVVDASVALKWILNDEDSVDQAVALRDDGIEGRFQLVAPSLWLYELTNGIVSAVRRRRLEPNSGSRSLALVRTIGVEIADADPNSTYANSIRYNLSAYDAAYVALAEALKAPLWTGDRRLYEATQPATQWVGDYA